MTLTAEFKLREPLPKYRATETLARHLIDHIVTGGFCVGSKFLSDNDIVTITGRSRTAVRQALNILQDQGWIDRLGGKGTFVGSKLDEYRSGNGAKEQFLPAKRESSMLRVAVAVSGLGEVEDEATSYSWYAGGVLQGIDETAEKANVSVELLGFHRSRSTNYAKRVAQNPPQAFLCIGPPMDHAPIIELAGRFGVPCVMAATRNPEFGLPNIYEDSVTAARDAVAHLVELGHRRIGYIQVMSPSGWWAFDRYEGFLNGVREFRLESELGLWLPLLPTEHSADMVRRYIDRFRLTAMVCGSHWGTNHLSELIRRDGLKIPDDLSCIVFDQDPSVRHMLGGVEPTTVRLPMREMGIAFVDMVHQLVEGKQIPMNTALPCTIVQGASTRQPVKINHEDTKSTKEGKEGN